MDSLLVKDNPLLLPMNKERTVYDGFITVQVRLHCCWRLKHLLRGYEAILKQVKAISNNKFEQRVCVQSRPSALSIPHPQSYSDLLSELETLGWDKLVFIDTDFRTLRLRANDSSGREHVLTVKLKTKHPTEAPECAADVPVPLVFHWTPQTTLAQLHSQFLQLVESLREFWDVLDEIDQKTWVLEPEKPCRSDAMRRIAIGNNASIKVEVDPRHPKMLPECCLLGAEHVVTPLRNKLNANMHLWNPECSVLLNLRDVLEIQFPSPATHEKSSLSVECGICYSFRLDSGIPDQVCNDPRCGQPFHQDCLYQWLRALPSTRQSFNTIFGECPYCSKPITVKMAVQK
uniref:E3 ubiquitin-protein ligase FANCL n=1 Tax=Periophthalmus magnuspinnatus TaxID=409849 RepID=A0A3B4A3D2_9GOBI